MKRLCIYVTYNKKNEIKKYIGYMLEAIRKYVDELCVVCNYLQINNGFKHIEPYADKIFYRENKGYDAGGYKDALCTLIGWDEVYKYDELILINDSFMGPFYDMGEYFKMMESIFCDFWGMTRQFSVELESLNYRYGSHVHSYFLVFRRDMLHSNAFRNFWENLIYPKTFAEAVLYFEIYINKNMQENGYESMALTDVWGMEFKENENPFLLYSFELIHDKRFPILKKKCLLIRNKGFADTLKAIIYLENSNDYPIKWIWEQLDSQFYIENYTPTNINCLEFFYKKYKRIYIYGAGVCGKNLAIYFRHKGWQHAGIIVSDTADQDIECIRFEDAQIDEETGIIVSVIHKEASEQIVNHIGSKCSREQLFILYECTAIRIPE